MQLPAVWIAFLRKSEPVSKRHYFRAGELRSACGMMTRDGVVFDGKSERCGTCARMAKKAT